jgi:DNA-binding FadR family transcriptional regulator
LASGVRARTDAAVVHTAGGDRLRVPKIAEMLADEIRRSIVRGELKEGDRLPSEAEMTSQFGISRPTLREAFRILESESLVIVRRGSRGGAEVRAPNPDVAARYAGLVLQARGTTLGEIYLARVALEPPAARLLADNADADSIRVLREALDDEADAMSDAEAFGRKTARFHELVVELAGNNPLTLFEHVLAEIIEVQQVTTWVDVHRGENPDPAALRRSFRRSHQTHRRLVELVQAGQPAEAEAWWRKHVQALEQFFKSQAARRVIDLFAD